MIEATARALWPSPVSPAFVSEKAVERLWAGLQLMERFGATAATIQGWTAIISPAASAQTRSAIAAEVRETIKARYEPETWQRVAQPIFDRLRRRQRDALVAHVMHSTRLRRDSKQLYEYFLIDPGMEPVVQTSRIRLAISSVQLFVQRCLLNLEPRVHPSAIINAEHWEWMKRYRVWEANRKIFLFPENWLEPEFRDDKIAPVRRAGGRAAARRRVARPGRGRVPELPAQAGRAGAARHRRHAPGADGRTQARTCSTCSAAPMPSRTSTSIAGSARAVDAVGAGDGRDRGRPPRSGDLARPVVPVLGDVHGEGGAGHDRHGGRFQHRNHHPGRAGDVSRSAVALERIPEGDMDDARIERAGCRKRHQG